MAGCVAVVVVGLECGDLTIEAAPQREGSLILTALNQAVDVEVASVNKDIVASDCAAACGSDTNLSFLRP